MTKKRKLLATAIILSAFAMNMSEARQVIDSNTSYSIADKTVSSQTGNGFGGAYQFIDNKSDPNIRSPLNVAISNTVFENNNATGSGYGGSFFVQDGTVNIDNSTFQNNIANWDGGAISTSFPDKIPANAGPKLVINNSTFDNNEATVYSGGAIGLYSEAEINNTKFTNNNAGGHNPADSTDGGGAIYLGGWGQLTLNNSEFTGNSSNRGGAIGTTDAGIGTTHYFNISNTTFDNNNATLQGGAIFSKFTNDATGNQSLITGSTFKNNTAGTEGGAVYNKGTLTVDNTTFDNNSAQYGGGFFNQTGATANFKDNISFTNNTAQKNGGGVYNYTGATMTIGDNAYFSGNKAVEAAGGAVQNMGYLTLGNNLIFENNSAAWGGAAVYGGSRADEGSSTIIGDNAIFRNNTLTDELSYGGAVFVENDEQQTTRFSLGSNSYFENNSAYQGGAVYLKDAITAKIGNGATFTGNSATNNGGALYTMSGVNLTDASFVNNTAGEQGGAIYSTSNVTIAADQKDVVFSGNNAVDGGDIYMAADNTTLTLDTGDKSITMNGGISGSNNGFNINVNGSGNLNLQSYVKNATVNINNMASLYISDSANLNGNNNTITLNDGTELVTLNNKLDSFDDGLLNVNGNVSLGFDVDLEQGKADDFSNITYGHDGKITIEGINPTTTNTTKDNFSFNIYNATGLDPSKATIDDDFVALDTLTPIRWLKGSIDQNGIVTYGGRGNAWSDFNPSVMVSPVAAQLGGYLVQLNSYDQAFMNLDMKMLMTQEERKALRMRNSYAAAGGSTTPMVFSPTYLPEKQSAGWVRPYATFENVRLDGGPRVSNVMYGTFFGADSEMYELKNGAEAQFSVYAGYNGSHQAFSGNSLWQNGGTLGLTGIVYKNNFFTALTANAGASVVDATTMYGAEDFPMLMAGVASKTGYNWELANGKFIIQPNYLMSYSFVNTFDYTNAAGVRMKSDPLNAIQIAPGVKFIGNLKNGWQPYINLRMVWNIMDKTDFVAANTSIPDLSVKPYFEYGLGLQKRWGERFTGYGQVMFRNGGRNGIALGFGFRWALGKAPAKADNFSDKVVIKEPAKLKLSNIK